jgi:hypothetical protein
LAGAAGDIRVVGADGPSGRAFSSSMHFRKSVFALVAIVLPLLAAAAGAGDKRYVVVPPGNRSETQPAISTSSVVRTAETKSSFEAKYQQVYHRLARDRVLLANISKTAALYGIDPIHMIGAIVGEHTYNVDVMDSLQGYYVKALEYLGESNLRFAYKGTGIAEFVARPEFNRCKPTSSYELWSCREDVWNDSFRGKTVGGTHWPDDRFERVFFQPFFAGQTFGLGQLSPLVALMVSDMVHDVGGLPVLDMNKAPEVYHAVMDPDLSLQYMAAVIRESIDVYKSVAGFDISKNPGLTATLYNTGGVPERARQLRNTNNSRHADGLAPLLPHENYYGWFVNDKLSDLQKLVSGGGE